MISKNESAVGLLTSSSLVLFPGSHLPYYDQARNCKINVGETTVVDASCNSNEEVLLLNRSWIGLNQCPKEWIVGLHLFTYNLKNKKII